jgi:hypothetical protein
LQKFGLPVFERVAHHLNGVTADVHGLLQRPLLVHIGEPAKDPVPGQRDDEQGRRDPRKAISCPDRFPLHVLPRNFRSVREIRWLFSAGLHAPRKRPAASANGLPIKMFFASNFLRSI